VERRGFEPLTSALEAPPLGSRRFWFFRPSA
jgi:hypothetical protein